MQTQKINRSFPPSNTLSLPLHSTQLNAERNNGRAAMMGIIGMMIHEGLTGNPVWPIPIPPQPVLELAGDDIEKGPARVGSFVLASLGMTFLGAVSAVPEFGKRS